MLTTDFVPGAPAWIDLGSPDPDAAAAFYGRVLGWEHQPLGTGTGLFTYEGRTVAAHVPAEPAGWTVYFRTRDAGRLGRDFAGLGRTYRHTDAQGARFGVWEGGERAGLDAVTSTGALAWLELRSPDPAGSALYYRSVFSWDVQRIPGAPGEFLRTEDAGPEHTFGAIVTDAEAYWLPYFEVADVDRAAGAARVVDEPFDLPGVGRIAVVADPFGARFGVMRSVTSESLPKR
ncbi:VOC family protein [Lentzea sp. NPDC059081]|uniref:VOC family protein n=1 Tax=Lentzea sp. NPDC059081 TaxID=3346719 RepID=UPI00369890CB